MLFNSLSFILCFLPLCLLLYYVTAMFSNRLAIAVLVGFSLLFYAWWNPAFLTLLCGSIAYNYAFGMILLRYQNRARLQNGILFVAILGDLLLLFHYKYLYPLLGWLDTIGLHIPHDLNSVVLPLGISFFTFTQIGYLVDCKAGVAKSREFLGYALFVSFFPHLIAGPILHNREMMPQFADPETYRFKLDNLCVGLVIFTLGFAKKVLIADHFVPLTNHAFAHPEALPAIAAWGGALSYALQLYFDFSGYCEMANGLALMFGMRFPASFNSPYKSRSIIDYWQRWNMTLTRYITLYLYNPAAMWVARMRARQGKAMTRNAAATPGGFVSMIAFPTFFTMILAGIWHGAGLQFLVFGLLHGTYITVNHAWRLWKPIKSDDRSWLDTIWKIGLTMLAIIVAQIFFRAPTMHDALMLLQNMVGANGFLSIHDIDTPPDFVETILFDNGFGISAWLKQIQFGAPLTVLLGFLWVFGMPNVLEITSAYQPTLTKIAGVKLAWRPNIVWGCVLGVIAAVAMLAITGTTEFLYFQF